MVQKVRLQPKHLEAGLKRMVVAVLGGSVASACEVGGEAAVTGLQIPVVVGGAALALGLQVYEPAIAGLPAQCKACVVLAAGFGVERAGACQALGVKPAVVLLELAAKDRYKAVMTRPSGGIEISGGGGGCSQPPRVLRVVLRPSGCTATRYPASLLGWQAWSPSAAPSRRKKLSKLPPCALVYLLMFKLKACACPFFGRTCNKYADLKIHFEIKLLHKNGRALSL